MKKIKINPNTSFVSMMIANRYNFVDVQIIIRRNKFH